MLLILLSINNSVRSTIQGGDVLIGSIDVSALVGNGTYNLRFLQRSLTRTISNFNDLQVVKSLVYSINIWE